MLKVHVLDRLHRHSSNVAHGVEVPAGARLLFTNGQVGTRDRVLGAHKPGATLIVVDPGCGQAVARATSTPFTVSVVL